ncbi:hypothetical protein [Blastococcus saxobsidens]|uniref:Uncharacterized protein n=1 Tax=Blastococcus saxobsidens TaxID=138336 RepID=A0A4Q7Y6D9_9ACTN|nr:hypothetical protein [Blastococcus saxobsidens]RZU31671.1 hypothetical protein BKA19_1348 [Blastococcus saxobsidens]
MTEQRPDTDEKQEPGGTPSPGPENLIDKPATPGGDGAGVVPGAYQADEADKERGKAVKPGN